MFTSVVYSRVLCAHEFLYFVFKSVVFTSGVLTSGVDKFFMLTSVLCFVFTSVVFMSVVCS